MAKQVWSDCPKDIPMVHLWMGLHGEYRIPESLVDEAKLAVMPHGWETSRLKAWVAEQEWKALNG